MSLPTEAELKKLVALLERGRDDLAEIARLIGQGGPSEQTFEIPTPPEVDTNTRTPTFRIC